MVGPSQTQDFFTHTHTHTHKGIRLCTVAIGTIYKLCLHPWEDVALKGQQHSDYNISIPTQPELREVLDSRRISSLSLACRPKSAE